MNDLLHKIWFKAGNSDLTLNPDGSMQTFGVDWLFMYILWVCIISFVLLMVPMSWWAFKYRRRPGHVQQRTPNHNTALEVTWVVVPLIVVTVMFFWGFKGYMRAQLASASAESLNVSAKKWAWSVTYANGAQSAESTYFDQVALDNGVIRRGNEKVPVFIVPEKRPVKFTLSSVDVLHSFYIPDMRIKIDVFPNRLTSLTFTPISAAGQDQAGSLYADAKLRDAAAKGMGRDHYIFCAEYCGSNHSEMAGVLRVLPEDEYIKTLGEWADVDTNYVNADGSIDPKKQADKQAMPLWQLGQWVHQNRGCAQCHTADGGKGSGPSWKGYYGTEVAFEGGSKLDTNTYPGMKNMDDAWAQYVRESILYPAAKIHGGYANQMPSYAGQLSDKQIAGVTAYLRHLAGKTDSVAPTGGAAPAAPAAGSK
jgi:cytochrome c oxidase subunit II